jgi:methylated-DNA-protein-cysteine methyltransferase-like protein
LVDPSDLADKDIREPRVIGPGFHEDVYAVVRLVPPGHVTTYGDVGTMLGSARIARQVGWALSSLPPTLTDVPWHRVINARGTVSFRGDLVRATQQETLLKIEGIILDEDGRLDLEAHRYRYPGIAVPYRSRDPSER